MAPRPRAAREIMNLSKYLEFRDQPDEAGKRLVAVVSKRQGTELGGIAWYAAWHQYVFIPNGETLYNRECLRDIADHIEGL